MTGNGTRSQNGNRNGNGGIAWLVGQMFVLPFRTFLYGMERLLDTMREMQNAGHRGMQANAGGGPVSAETGGAPDNPPDTGPSSSNENAGSDGMRSEIQET